MKFIIKEKQIPQHQNLNMQQPTIISDQNFKNKPNQFNNISPNTQQFQSLNKNQNLTASKPKQNAQFNFSQHNNKQHSQPPLLTTQPNSIKLNFIQQGDGNKQSGQYQIYNKIQIPQPKIEIEKNVTNRILDNSEDERIKKQQINDLLALKEKMIKRIQERKDSQLKEADQINSSFND